MKHKQIVRERFRTAVFGRDRQCRFCPPGTPPKDLDAHHITDRNQMPNGGYVASNGIALCPGHHLMAERFHVSGGTTWADGMHPDDLYRKIGSTYVKAVHDSERL